MTFMYGRRMNFHIWKSEIQLPLAAVFGQLDRLSEHIAADMDHLSRKVEQIELAKAALNEKVINLLS